MAALATLGRKNALIFALALAGSIPYGCHAAASLACGGGIQIVNLLGLECSVRRIATAAATGERPAVRPLLFLRFAGVAAAVGLCLWALPLAVGPFAVGLSTVVPAALWHGLDPSAGRTGKGV